MLAKEITNATAIHTKMFPIKIITPKFIYLGNLSIRLHNNAYGIICTIVHFFQTIVSNRNCLPKCHFYLPLMIEQMFLR